MKTGSQREHLSAATASRVVYPSTGTNSENEFNFGKAGLAEWNELAHEQDTGLRSAGMLGLAKRLQSEERFAAASQVYAAIAADENNSQKEKAQGELAAMSGQGPWGLRAEFLLHRFAQEATRPSSILAMGAAGFAYRLTRAATLSRLALSPAGFFTRGFGLQASGFLLGFSAETIAFTGVGKATAALSGEAVDLSREAFLRDWAAGALSLGVLKGAGALAQGVGARWAVGTSFLPRVTRTVLPQAAMFGGLLVAQRVEQSLGLREGIRGGHPYLDAMVSLLHLHVGGRLAGRFLGAETHGLEAHLMKNSERLSLSEPWDGAPQGAFAMAHGGRIKAREFFSEAPKNNAAMMSQSLPGGGGRDLGTFRLVRQIETKLSGGSILIDLATREQTRGSELILQMYSLEDGFTSLLHGYSTREAKLLRGPLVQMLWGDPALRQKVLDYGSDSKRALWAFIDADTGELQRIVAFDSGNKPVLVLLWNPGSNGKGERPKISSLYSLEFAESSDAPVINYRLFLWDAESKYFEKVHEEQTSGSESSSSSAEYEVKIFSESPEAMLFTRAKTDANTWRLQDSKGQLLLATRLLPEHRRYFFEYSHIAPPLPKLPSGGNPTPPRVRSAAVKRPFRPAKSGDEAGSASVSQGAQQTPVSEESELSDSKGLTAARSTLQDLESLRLSRPKEQRKVLSRLRQEWRRLSSAELKGLAEDLASRIELFLSIQEPGELFLKREIPLMPPFVRLRLSTALAQVLVDANPILRAQSFGVFREVVPHLGTYELHGLQKVLDGLLPPGTKARDRTMVDQVRILVRDALASQGGSGLVPPAAPLALLIGGGVLLDASQAHAASGDLLLGLGHSLPTMPGAGVAMATGLMTLALRSAFASRLGISALSLGSAILSRMTALKTAAMLPREGRYPYELRLPDFEKILHKGAETEIARRGEGAISLHTNWVSRRLPAYERLPEGTLRVNLRVEEGKRMGLLTLYVEKDAIHLQNIETERMGPGVGTIMIDWLASQAALRGMRFHIRDIYNPQIFRILNRESIFLPETAQVEGSFHDPETAGKQWVKGAVEDSFFAEEHSGAAFHVTGALNSKRLPFYLRGMTKSGFLKLPQGHQ